MIRLLKNLTTSTIVLTDLNGLTIASGVQADGLSFGEEALRCSTSVQALLLSGSLSLYDGTQEYFGNAAIDVLKGTVDQLTRDGKKIFTASDRPINHYRHITGYGDDMANKLIGEGPGLVFNVAASSSSVIDVQFIDDVYMRDGTIQFENAAPDCHLSIETFVPPNIPFPALLSNGNTDFNGTTFVPNTTNTGKFWILATETRLFRFVNKLHILGTGREPVSSPEPVLIPSPYITRFTLSNASTTAVLSACINMGLYRKQTV